MEQEFSNAKVMGCACVITSGFTAEEIANFRNYLPDALCLKDEKDHDIFRIGLDDDGNPGSIHQDHILFCKEKVPEGKATVTLIVDPSIEDKVGLIRERMGLALIRLESLEKQMRENMSRMQENMRKAEELVSHQ